MRTTPPSYQLQYAPSECLGGALRVDIREIEKQGRGSVTAHRPVRQCFCVQAVFPHARNKPTIRPSALQPQDQVHSSRLGINSQVFPQHAFQACRCRFPALGIELPHPLDMAREMPFRDEGRDDGLRKLGTAACKV